MANLKNVSTRDLVEELSQRTGIERINVAAYTQNVEIVVNQGPKYVYDAMFTGPQIILRIAEWDAASYGRQADSEDGKE